VFTSLLGNVVGDACFLPAVRAQELAEAAIEPFTTLSAFPCRSLRTRANKIHYAQ
jgi:hypothetical protein